MTADETADEIAAAVEELRRLRHRRDEADGRLEDAISARAVRRCREAWVEARVAYQDALAAASAEALAVHREEAAR